MDLKQVTVAKLWKVTILKSCQNTHSQSSIVLDKAIVLDTISYIITFCIRILYLPCKTLRHELYYMYFNKNSTYWFGGRFNTLPFPAGHLKILWVLLVE